MLSNSKLYLCSNESVTYDSNYRYQVNIPVIEHNRWKGSVWTGFVNSKSFAESVEISEELFNNKYNNL
jgi:CTP synthase (UTP-ammonia lyase)